MLIAWKSLKEKQIKSNEEVKQKWQAAKADFRTSKEEFIKAKETLQKNWKQESSENKIKKNLKKYDFLDTAFKISKYLAILSCVIFGMFYSLFYAIVIGIIVIILFFFLLEHM